MKKFIQASAALAAGIALVAVPLTAYADEVVPEAPPVVAEVADEPIVEPAPEVAPAPEPVIALSISTPESRPGQHQPPQRLAICHSGSGKNWTYISPDAQGYNGHQHHSADIYGLTEAECLAKNFQPYAGSGLWLIPASWDHTVTPYYTAAIFPQDRIADVSLIPCERWAQSDGYWIENAAEEAIYNGLGDVLTQGEDSSIYASHEFIYGGDCAPELPEPQVCSATGDWFTEDVAPAATPEGLVFSGPSTSAINWLHPVTGNIQGLGTQSYTIASAADYHAGFRIVVNPNAGSLHYASITAEPYFNGWAPGQTGTFTVDSTTLVWSSKIPSGPGSQSQPIPLGDFPAIWPDNQLLAIGAHLGSNSPEGRSTTVSAFTGCVEADFTYDPTTYVDPAEPEWIDPCGEGNGYWSYQDGEGYHFQAHPNGELVLTADEGFAFVEGQQTWWQETDSNESCPPTVVEVQPLVPTFVDLCGVEDDEVNVPEDGELVTFEVIDERVDGVGTVTVNAVLPEGYVFHEEIVASWSHEFTNEACPTEEPTPTPSETPTTPGGGLADTGTNATLPLSIAGFLITGGLIAALVAAFRRRQTQV